MPRLHGFSHESHFDISVSKSLLLFMCRPVRQSVDGCRTHPSFNPLIYLLCITCHTPYLFLNHGTVRTYVYIFLPSSLLHLLLSRPSGGKCRTNYNKRTIRSLFQRSRRYSKVLCTTPFLLMCPLTWHTLYVSVLRLCCAYVGYTYIEDLHSLND